ncbi:hypothetical protein OAS19_04765 [Altererythrobacter sp.]|nr:hypothetical protein [Altererythrobacter sp.]
MRIWNAMLALVSAALIIGSSPVRAETWHRADSKHFTIYSSGGERQLEDFAHEAERFDALLRTLFSVRDNENARPLTIYLVPRAKDIPPLLSGSQSGAAGFYRRNLMGTYAVSHREFTARGRLGPKGVLFHEYAHHFMFNNFSQPFPFWFVEGFAEFVSTSEFKRNGEWTFGRPAQHRASSLFNARKVPIRELLAERPDLRRGGDASAFYGWSWALTHMLYLDNGDGGDSIGRYLGLINRGTSSLEAAETAFGDLDELENRMRNYVRKSMRYSRSPDPLPYNKAITVTRLDDHGSALRELVLRRGSTQGDFPLANTRDSLLALANAPDADAETWYQLAEAEFQLAMNRSEDEDEKDEDDESAADNTVVIEQIFSTPEAIDDAAAEAAARQALSLNADHPRANLLQGRILMRRAELETDNKAEAALYDEARTYFRRANAAANLDPLPLYFFARSQLQQGKPGSDTNAMLGAAFSFSPETSDLRAAYAFDLARIGKFDEAIALMTVLANNPHGGAKGRAAVKRIERLRDRREAAMPAAEPQSASQ